VISADKNEDLLLLQANNIYTIYWCICCICCWGMYCCQVLSYVLRAHFTFQSYCICSI